MLLRLLSNAPVLLSFFVTMVTADAVRVAECRARCLDKFLSMGKPQAVTDEQCKATPDCFMCWDSCHLLQENFAVWGSMCTDGAICFPGCQQACGFVTVPDTNAVKKPVPASRFPSAVQLLPRGETGVHLTWPRLVPAPSSHVVFLVHRRTRSGANANQWHEVVQTCEHTTFVEDIVPGKKLDLRVLAVIGEGQVAETIVTYAALSSMHQDEQSLFKKPAESKVKEVPIAWRPRIVSMQSNPHLSSVDVMVTWEAPAISGREEYLVKWEVIEGSFDVTGHLYTDATTITLTLAANSVFSIQVQMASGSLKSESVVVNTLLPTLKNELPDRLRDEKDTFTSIQGECGLWWSIVAGVSTAVSLALVLIVIMLIVRWWPTSLRMNRCSISRQEEKKNRKQPKPLDIEEGLYDFEQELQSSPRLEGKLRNLQIFMKSMEKVADTLSPVYANTSNPIDSQHSPPPYGQHELSILATPTSGFFPNNTPVFINNDKRSGANNEDAQDLSEHSPSQRSRLASTHF